MFKAIDISMNAFLPETSARFLDLGFWKWMDEHPDFAFGGGWVEKITKGWSGEWMAENMEKDNVDKGFLIALWLADGVGGREMFTRAEEVAQVIEKFPNKFVGLVGVNPLKGMETIRYIDKAIRELGFKGVHIYPHWFGVPIYEKQYYPIYSKCAELDVPVVMQISMQTPNSRASFSGRPTYLDSVALDFPELRIVAIHIGHPLEDELIMMCWAHENIYIGADVWSPTIWTPNLVEYMTTVGQDRVMWGTDFPLQDWAVSISQVKDRIKDEKIQQKILRDNAIKCFKL